MTSSTLPAEVDLAIGGMTCASCAARVEKRLNKLEGVSATVNFATERAHVTVPDGVGTDTLIAEVEAAGYTAAEPGSSDRRRRRRPTRTRNWPTCGTGCWSRPRSPFPWWCWPWCRPPSSTPGSGCP